MSERVLITGGAGFIGAHLAAQLLSEGSEVRVLDSMLAQVHGESSRPAYLDDEVELIRGDVRDREAVDRALTDVDRVVHLAARVGVGQSMYEIAEYTSVNGTGTAVLLEALSDHPVAQLVVASSMSVYGEGLYVDASGRPAQPAPRSRDQLAAGDWEPRSVDGDAIVPAATPETKPPDLASVYALNKYEQERLSLIVGAAYNIPTVALRFFNVYGPYQALSNPYTGVLAIFASRMLNDRSPMVFEDGDQRRDFVSVHDVARACALATRSAAAAGQVINIGSGASLTVNEISARLATALDREQLTPTITGRYRVGDIRHCFADITLARSTLGFEPSVALDDGIAELAEWLADQVAVDDVDHATKQLEARGLTV